MFVRYKEEKMQAEFSSKCSTKAAATASQGRGQEAAWLLVLLPAWEWRRVERPRLLQKRVEIQEEKTSLWCILDVWAVRSPCVWLAEALPVEAVGLRADSGKTSSQHTLFSHTLPWEEPTLQDGERTSNHFYTAMLPVLHELWDRVSVHFTSSCT